MFKKSLGSIALASLLFTGLSVSPANADTPYVAESNLGNVSANFSTQSSNSTSVVIPEGASYLHSDLYFEFEESFLLAHAGETLNFNVTVTDPSSTPLSLLTNLGNNARGYTKSAGGYLNKVGTPTWVNADYETSNLVIPSDPTGYQGSYTPQVEIIAANESTGGTLEAGTYTINFTLTAAGNPVGAETGLTHNNLRNSFSTNGNTVVIPEGVISTSLSGTACVDSTKIAVGDVLKAEIYLDDTLQGNFGSSSWQTRSSYKSRTDVGYRQNDNSLTVTATQYDIDFGLAVRTYTSPGNLAEGSEHDLQFKLFNTATNADVSGTCAPAKPETPVATFSQNQLSVTGKLSFGSDPYNTGCYAYDKTAPTTIARTAFVNFNMMASSDAISCSFSGLTSGHTYFVRLQTFYIDKGSELSEPSAEILIPAGGYTFNTNYAGVIGAGKVMKVSDTVLPIEGLGTNTQVIADGKSGIYTLGSAFSCSMSCGTSQARIRHFNADKTLDTAFGGNGAIVLDSFTPSNASVNGFAYYGTNKDKWFVPVTGMEGNSSDQKVQLIFGTTNSSTTTSKDINKASLNAACNAGAAGYGMRQNYTPQISVYAMPVANPLMSITCYKQYTFADSSTQALPLNVLVSVDPATGALTAKGTLGTPSADANGFSTRTSINHDATGNEPMLTVLVSSYKYTSNNNMMLVGTVADHSIIRISSTGTFLSTTGSAWGTSGGNYNMDMVPSISSVNSGKIYGIQRSGMNSNLLSIGTSGVATSLAVDASASTIMGGSLNPVNGYAVASNETLIPVSVQGPMELAAGWVNVSTGVLTVGEKLSYTSSPGNGNALIWLNGNDKNTYLLVSASTAADYLTVLKWVDSRYTSGSSAQAQTITLTGPTNPEVDLDGIDLVASTTSGLALTFATTTPSVCTVDALAHVTAITAGACVVTASQAGNASFLSATAQVTVNFVAPATTPLVDNGNPAQPTAVSKTGAWVKNGDTQLSWNRTKGTLAFKVSVVYIGPIKGTAVFKIGSKTHTCVVNFGTLKKQTTAKRLVLTSPNLCSGAKEKVQLAALKKAPVNMVVKLTIARDMKYPTTYAKYRTKTRVIYAKLG